MVGGGELCPAAGTAGAKALGTERHTAPWGSGGSPLWLERRRRWAEDSDAGERGSAPEGLEGRQQRNHPVRAPSLKVHAAGRVQQIEGEDGAREMSGKALRGAVEK